MEISFSSVHYIPQLKATVYAFLAAKCENYILDVIFAHIYLLSVLLSKGLADR